jgi:hypothetical protein
VKLKAIIGDKEEEVLLEFVDGRVSARVGARTYELQAREIEPGRYLFFWNGHVREFRVDESIRIIDPKHLRSGQNNSGHHQ